MVFSDISALMESWLSPTPLFIFLNLMIATIFFISRLSPHKTPYAADEDDRNSFPPPPPLQPAPSFISRVTSFNFSTCRFPLSNTELDGDGSAAHPLERAPSILERVKSISYFYKYSPQNTEIDYSQPPQQPLSQAPSLLERVKSLYKSDSTKSNQTEPTVTDPTGSDTGISPVHGEVKRVQSEPKLRQRVKEEVEIKRYVTAGIVKPMTFEEDEAGVDAKADDFINNFKKQLRLQRLDSLLRYRDMLKRK